jgi:hypothetical protein
MDKFVKRSPSPNSKRRADSPAPEPASPEKKTKILSLQEALHVPSPKFSTVKEFEARFAQIADIILNNTVLVANKRRYRLLEIEFYFTSSTHNDPFTHGHEIQSKLGNWYFHRHGSQYRGGTYKGLDISIGNNPDERGGILFRAVEAMDTGDVICGPSLTVDHLLAQCQSESIRELVDEKMKGEIGVEQAEGKPLYISFVSDLPQRMLLASPRVGLQPTKAADASLQVAYVNAHYRFFVPHKKLVKGRFWMFLALNRMGKSKEEILRLAGGTSEGLRKVLERFENGKKKKPESFVGRGKLTDEDFAEFYGAYLASQQ